MIKNIGGSPKSIERDSQIVYDYLCQSAIKQSPKALIGEFQILFTQGKTENIQVSQALEKIIFDPVGQQRFAQFFSHCFYRILNCWVAEPESLFYVAELLGIFETIKQSRSYDRRRKQLLKLIQDYQQSPSYFQLQIVISIINPQEIANVALPNGVATNETSSSQIHRQTIIYNYLIRYTYLYEFFCPLDPELEQLSQLIQTLANNRCQDFEFKLSKHILYRFRLKQIARMKLLSKGAGKIITKAENPSLLSERAFSVALKQYLGKIEQDRTLLERSQRFVADNQLRDSYQVFKQDLGRFLTYNLKPRNHNYHFESNLNQKLNLVFPHSDNKPINSTLILQTCRQLFSFLLLDAQETNNPQKFADLVANLGTAQVMLILIKITLICPESKADLTKKLAAIATHYQFSNIQDAAWVLKTLEHCLIALAIYFGKVDVSLASKSLQTS